MSFISQPIFLVGAERSGTTLLRLMLNHHSQLAWCSEFEYAVDLISERQKLPNLYDYYQWLESHRIFKATQFSIDYNLDYSQLLNSFLIQKKNSEKKLLVCATVHRHFDRLLRIWSDARFIHIVRDGRDVARSCIGMGWAGNVWTGAERWIEAENLWKELSKSLPQEQKIEVTYESLITQPESTLNDLCNFIGISFEPEMLTYHEATTYDLPNPKLIKQWKQKLSEREIQLVESQIDNILLERSYELSGLPSIEVTSLMKQILRIHCWLKRVIFRIKRFGFYLFIGDYLSRHLQLNSWQKDIKLKINAIENSFLK